MAYYNLDAMFLFYFNFIVGLTTYVFIYFLFFLNLTSNSFISLFFASIATLLQWPF